MIDDEIGRNSESPCTIPSTIAWSISIRSGPSAKRQTIQHHRRNDGAARLHLEIGAERDDVEQHARDGSGEGAFPDRLGEFAVADHDALDTDRDREARALVRMAQCSVALTDPKDQARAWLTEVSERFGDTPWAGKARELLKGL